MFELAAMSVTDLKRLLAEPMNSDLGAWPDIKVTALSNQPYSFTGLVNKEIVICGGLIEYWEGRAHLWTIFSRAYEKYPLASFRGLKKFMEIQPYRRVEVDVPTDFEKAHRRMRLLGFQLECRIARKFSEEGQDRSLYSWVRD